MQRPHATVGVGLARHADAATAARAAVRQARQTFPATASPGWLLCFAGGRHDGQALARAFQEELGSIPLVGGCGCGVIGAASASTSGYECGVLLFPDSLAPLALLAVDGLDQDELRAGLRLGQQLQALDLPPGTTVLLFYDSVRGGPPPVLHIGSRLLDGLHAGLDGAPVQVIGTGTLGDMALSSSYVFDGHAVAKHTAVAVVLPAALVGHTAVTHGCLPASDFLQITRLEGARVLELDGRPALDVVEERLGVPRAELLARQPLPSLTLGEKQGDPFAPFHDGLYVNRLVVAIEPEAGALVLFEADFRVGSRVQLMAYEPSRMIDSAREQTQALLAGLPPHDPVFALYIDCAGRSMAFNGLDEDEADPVRQQLEAVCPLLGLYSGVEIAPFQGRAMPLDWTGVLAVFTRAPDAAGSPGSVPARATPGTPTRHTRSRGIP